MSDSAAVHDRPIWHVRGWALWLTPRNFVALTLAVVVVATVGCAALVITEPTTGTTVQRMILFFLLSVAFEDMTRRVERLRFRLTTKSLVDLSSVWIFAAIVLLPPGHAMLLIVAMRAYLWLRPQRAAGMRLYRHVYTTAAYMMGALAASATSSALDLPAGDLTSGRAALAVAAALIVYFIVPLVLVVAAMYLALRPPTIRDLLPEWSDVGLEVATLCLGGLLALAMLYQPWLTLLVLPPLLLLQRSALVSQLEEAATIDAKTGLLNPISWQRVAQREIARAERERSVVAILIADLDHFKDINDTYGHLIGDAVLSEVGRCLEHELRDYDTVGRFGGEEFVAVLPAVDIDVAVAVAERIRVRVASLRIAPDGQISATALEPGSVPVPSVSIGVSAYPVHGLDLVTLLHAADEALYDAKRSGRNRVARASGGGPTEAIRVHRPA